MDAESLAELFRPFGKVVVRRLFSGFGIYHRDFVIAVVIRGDLMFKADEKSAPAFAAAGSRQWSYQRENSKKPTFMPFWHLPPSAFDDEDELVKWAKLALGAARRREAVKTVKGRKKAKKK